MNLVLRILLFVYAFCLTIISALSMLASVKTDIFYTFSGYMTDDVLPNTTARIILFIVSMVFFILSLIFLLSGLKNDRDKKAVSKYTNIGEIKISLNTIENIALSAAKRLMGVKESKAYVIKLEDTVSIAIKLVALPDVNLPMLAEDVQVKVKSAIEECSGIKVNDVRVVVENIHTGYKSRVE